MKRIFIWLDDERPINPIWIKRADDDIYFIKFKNALGLIEWYQTKSNEYDKIFISFDHDLGSEFTGYDVAKFIVDNKCNLTGFAVHSMNPVGAMNIFQLLTHYGYHKMSYTGEINTL